MKTMDKYGITSKLGDIPEIKVNSDIAAEAAAKYLELDNERAALEKMVKDITSRRDAYKVEILCCVGDVEQSIVQNGGSIYAIKNNKICKHTVDDTRLKQEQPDIYKKYLHGSYSASFKIKPIL
jgi:predicted phage-related endonuclease